MITVIETALPVFLALAMGMWCRSKQFISRDGVDTLKKVIINLTLPFVLFDAFATADYSLEAMIQPVLIFLICVVSLMLGHLLIRMAKMPSRLAPFLNAGFEAGMLGFSLFALLFPDESASKFAMLVMGQELFVFTIYKSMLVGKSDLRSILRDMAATPTLWALVLGVLVGATGLYQQLTVWGVAGIVDSLTSFVSAPTGMIILLSVGYDLVLKEIPWKKTVGLVALRLLIMGLMLGILILLNRTVLHGIIFEGAAVLLFILPPPYVIPIFADEPGERVQISSALSAMTVVSMVLFAVLSLMIHLG